jgi:hypothetical protein
MKISIEKILEFRDLFPCERNFDIKNVLCKYNRNTIVRLVNCLGMNFGNSYLPNPNNPFFSDISQKRLNELNPLFDKYLKRNNLCKVIFCTQRSILELMRVTFSIPTQNFQNNGLDEDLEYDFFRIILFINEQLMSFNSSQDIKEISTIMFLTCYVLNDVTGNDWKECLQAQIYYVHRLAEFLETHPQGVCLKKGFLKKVGISSFNEYIQTILALTVLYVDEQNKNRKGCPMLNMETLSDEAGFIHRQVIEHISIDINDLIPYDNYDTENRDNNTDYRVFRSHPLVKVSNNEYIIYSLPLLCERLYNSLFFDLKEFWSNGDYFQFYNKIVVEHHIFQNSLLNCIGTKSSYFYPNKYEICSSESTIELPNQPDFYIRERDAIILFECKGIKLNGKLKDKADVDDLLRVIKNKLYQSSENIDIRRKKKKKEELVGVTQLVSQINLIEDDNFHWDNQIPADVAYYPVLVLEDPKLCQIGLSGIINRWYQPLISDELKDAMCYPIIIMSIDILFLYSETFKKFGFHTVFDRFFKEYVKYEVDGVNWQISPFADINSYMREKYEISPVKRNFGVKFIDKISK